MAGGRLTDWISLGVLASWVPADAVDDAIEAAGKQAQRRGGKLPPRVTAYLVMALALFAQVARPVAVMETGGAFLGRWRRMSIDGMAWDIPDTPAKAAAFGYPRAGKDGSPGAFPKAQVVTVS